MIYVHNLKKNFTVHQKEPGLKGSLKSLFARKWIEKEALKSVSLEIAQGEIVGLIGANGAGKTTLVKILSGIIFPTSGEAKVLGATPWERKNDFRRQISLVMGQKASLWWDLPAADCFLLLKEIYQIPPKQYEAQLRELVKILDIENQLNIPIRRLSLGERMKLELIAALLHQPKVIFLDEPTIGLDLSAQKNIREFLLDYQKRNAPSMILTSHYMGDITHLCQRIIILKEGSIIYDGALNKVSASLSECKIITLNWDTNSLPNQESISLPFSLELCQIQKQDSTLLKLKVKKEIMAEVVTYLLQQFKPIDLSIEEEDIAEVIEVLLKKGFSTHHA